MSPPIYGKQDLRDVEYCTGSAVIKRRGYRRSHDQREVQIGSASWILTQLAVNCYYDVMRLCAIIWQPYACSGNMCIVGVRRFSVEM